MILDNFCNFRVLLAKKSKIPKKNCFEKAKIEEEKNSF